MRVRVALVALVVLGVGCGGSCDDKGTGGGATARGGVISVNLKGGVCDDIPACARDCDAGIGESCRRLGASYQMGSKVGKDEALATQLFERACAVGDQHSCVSAGQNYEYGHGVTKDEPKALAFYRNACDAAYGVGCFNEGLLLERGGAGVPKDESRALDRYMTACKAGLRLACDSEKTLRGRLGK